MKNKIGLLGMAGIPLVIAGLVVSSVAMAAPNPAPAADSSVQAPVAASVQAPADTDVETNDDATVSASANASSNEAADVETNDDASGPQEAPGTETAD